MSKIYHYSFILAVLLILIFATSVVFAQTPPTNSSAVGTVIVVTGTTLITDVLTPIVEELPLVDDISTPTPISNQPAILSVEPQPLNHLENILLEGRLRVGIQTNYEPFGFIDERGDLVGFEADLAREFALRWLGSEEQVVLVPVDAEDRVDRLLAGEIDLIIATLPFSWQDEMEVDFSQIYFQNGQSLLVRAIANNRPEYNSISDLNDATVSVMLRSQSETNLVQLAYKGNVRINISYGVVETAAEGLQNRIIDAYTGDTVRLAQALLVNEDLQLSEQIAAEPYFIGLPQGAHELETVVNATLQAMRQDGVYESLFLKWFHRLESDLEPYLSPTLDDDISGLESRYQTMIPQFRIARSDLTRLDLIQMRGDVVVVGVKYDFPPFGFINEGELDGFDIDILKAMSELWELDVTQDVIFEPVTSDDRIDKLLTNEVDFVISSMSHTWSRAQLIDFSQTYFEDTQDFLVRQTDNITGLQTLTGTRVGVLAGSTSLLNISDLTAQVVLTPVVYIEPDDVLAALSRGEVDSFSSDKAVLSYIAQQNSNFEILNQQLTREPYGLGLPKGDQAFRDFINCSLQQLKMDGTYDRIYRKWFGQDNPPYPIEILSGTCSYSLLN